MEPKHLHSLTAVQRLELSSRSRQNLEWGEDKSEGERERDGEYGGEKEEEKEDGDGDGSHAYFGRQNSAQCMLNGVVATLGIGSQAVVGC